MDDYTIIQELTKVGGKLWEKDGKRRVYFNKNALCKLFGLEYSTYGTGNISSATIDGEPTSNSHAKKLLWQFSEGKFFYDFFDHKFHTYQIDEDVRNAIIEEIAEKTGVA